MIPTARSLACTTALLLAFAFLCGPTFSGGEKAPGDKAAPDKAGKDAKPAKCKKCDGSSLKKCDPCKGKGELQKPCADCKGKGYNKCTNCNATARLVCTTCQGKGRVKGPNGTNDCYTCNGGGRTLCSACTNSGKPGHTKCFTCQGVAKFSGICDGCMGTGKLSCKGCVEFELESGSLRYWSGTEPNIALKVWVLPYRYFDADGERGLKSAIGQYNYYWVVLDNTTGTQDIGFAPDRQFYLTAAAKDKSPLTFVNLPRPNIQNPKVPARIHEIFAFVNSRRGMKSWSVCALPEGGSFDRVGELKWSLNNQAMILTEATLDGGVMKDLKSKYGTRDPGTVQQ